MKYIKICPKCKSLKIALKFKSLWFFGFPASHQCMDCGYVGRIFPEIKILETLKNQRFLVPRKSGIFSEYLSKIKKRKNGRNKKVD